MSAHFFSLSIAARTQGLLSDETGISRCIAVEGTALGDDGPRGKKPRLYRNGVQARLLGVLIILFKRVIFIKARIAVRKI